MFDRLIESEPEGAEFHGRKRYFMVSSVVMGILFTTAVVYSLYAAEVGLGTENFYLTAMIAPVTEPVAPADIEQPRKPEPQQQSRSSALPVRQSAMSRTDEPTIVPATTSVVANTQLSRPRSGPYVIGKVELEAGSHSGPARSIGGSGTETHATLKAVSSEEPSVAEVAPPPVKKPSAKPVTSLGVINGRAINLPVPKYPATAGALNLQGKVDVQVLIDESGSVISANAISGHPILRASAVQAARGAKFSTTYLSKVPVKVSGVIVYNFKR